MTKIKYVKIYDDIIEQIQSGKLKPNEKLPSENELVETSRETVRKALNLLSQNGYIQKIRGKGSFVLEMSKYQLPFSGLVSFKEIVTRMGKDWKTIVNDFDLIQPDEHLQKELEITEKDWVWKVVRTRMIDGERIILDKDFFNKKYVPVLSKEICEDSIYEYLENELDLKISFAKKEFFVDTVTGEDRELLDVKGDQHIVVVKSHVYLEDTSLFQYSESRHRLDKFRFIDFARRGQ